MPQTDDQFITTFAAESGWPRILVERAYHFAKRALASGTPLAEVAEELQSWSKRYEIVCGVGADNASA